MKSTHNNLNALLHLDQYLNKRVLFISEKTPDRSAFYNWIPSKIIRQLFFQGIKACEMAFVVLSKAHNYDVIFIFEHKPWYSFFLYLACVIKGKPTFFIIHGIQQTYRLSYSRTIGFKMLLFFEKRFKFWPVHLEKSDQDFTDCLKFSKSKIVLQIPFPKELQVKMNKRKLGSTLRIGIAGMIRPDKPIMPLVKILAEYSKENTSIEIFVGTPFWQLPEELKNMSIQLVDTAQTDQYSSFLDSLDIAINYYEKDSFYYRSSGVLNDSVGAGCFMLVPDYPILKEQITNPVKVGETYNDVEDLKNTLHRSIDYIRNNEVEFEKWREFRFNENILKNLSDQMKTVLN